MILENSRKMHDGRRIRVIKEPDGQYGTKRYPKQPVIDYEGVRDVFIQLKKEHGRDISDSVLSDHFSENPRDFQRFLINELGGVFNDLGVDGIIGPLTAKDASRINYVFDVGDIKPELFAGKEIRPTLVPEISRDTDKHTVYGQSENAPPIEIGVTKSVKRSHRKKKSQVKRYK